MRRYRSPTRHADLLWCVAGGALGVALFHGRQLASGLQVVPGDELDARFVAAIVEHLRQVASGRAAPLSPGFFFPTRGVLAYSDAHLLVAIPHALLRALGISLLGAAALSVMLLDAATWIATFFFLRAGLGFRPSSSLLGAFLFVFSSAKLNQIPHAQLQALVLIPAMAWCLIRALENASAGRDRGTLRALALCSVFAQLQLWTAYQVAWTWGFEVAIMTGVALARRSSRSAAADWLHAQRRPLLLLALVNTLALVPFVVAYGGAARVLGWRRWQDVEPSLPHPASYAYMGRAFLWGPLSGSIGDARALPLHWEQALGLGLVGTVALAASFAWAVARLARGRPLALSAPRSADGRRDVAMLASLAGLTLFVLTLEVDGFSLWRAVFAVVPGAAAIRTVSRYVVVSALGLAIFTALAFDELAAWRATARGARARVATIGIALLGTLLLVEQAGDPPSFDRRASDGRVAALVDDLRARPDCEAFAISYAGRRRRTAPLQVDAMLAALESARPTLNGYSGWSPPGWRLWDLKSLRYPSFVAGWSAHHGLGRACTIAVAVP